MEKEQRSMERLTSAAERKKKAIDEELAKATAKKNRKSAVGTASSAERSASASTNGIAGTDVALPR